MVGMLAMKVIGAQMPAGLMMIPESGRWLRWFDVAAHDGRAPFPTTTDVRVAALFPTAAEALAYWRTQSAVVPLRPDGEPNRPLSALTVEFILVNVPAVSLKDRS